jgi:hypothetical protein
MLLVGFVAWCCYNPAQLPPSHGVNRVWGTCVLLFVVGAYVACFVDSYYGIFPPNSLRAWLVSGGVALMLIALAIMYLLQRDVSSHHYWKATVKRTRCIPAATGRLDKTADSERQRAELSADAAARRPYPATARWISSKISPNP